MPGISHLWFSGRLCAPCYFLVLWCPCVCELQGRIYLTNMKLWSSHLSYLVKKSKASLCQNCSIFRGNILLSTLRYPSPAPDMSAGQEKKEDGWMDILSEIWKFRTNYITQSLLPPPILHMLNKHFLQSNSSVYVLYNDAPPSLDYMHEYGHTKGTAWDLTFLFNNLTI